MWTGLEGIVQTKRMFGWKAAAKWIVSRAAQKLLRVDISEMLRLDFADLRRSIETDPQFEFRFLSADEVAAFAEDPANDLDPRLAARADCGFDFCIAAVSEFGELASYSW
jgi:hypothetical protein